MNNINITIELCAEDRARLDRLTAALEHKACDACVAPAPTGTELNQNSAEVTAKASDHAEPPKNAVEEAEPSTLTTTPSEEETPKEEEIAPAEETIEPTVTLEEIQQKVVQLAAANNGAKKVKVREIVNAYAKRVSDLPEDKWTEIWEKLVALESEG